MPYKNAETQREADKFYHKRRRLKLKQEAEKLGKKFEEDIPDTPENLNYGMTENREKPMSREEFLELNPTLTDKEFIQYKIKWSFQNKWKVEKETEDKRKSFVDREHFGTQNHDCQLWRRLYEKGQFSDYRFNHLDACLDCQKWYARHKNDPLDLNDTKRNAENFEELKGYSDAFREPNPNPEDYMYTPNGAYPMSKICGFCGRPLDEKGRCKVCDNEE